MVGRSESVYTQMHANSPYLGSSGIYIFYYFVKKKINNDNYYFCSELEFGGIFEILYILKQKHQNHPYLSQSI